VPTATPAKADIHEGDLVVPEGETHEIINEILVIQGGIIVEQGGTLIIRNSDITVNSRYKGEYFVRVRDKAALIVEGSVLREGPVPGLNDFGDFGGIDHFRLGETTIIPEGENATVVMRNSTSELRMGQERGAVVELVSSYLSLLFWKPMEGSRVTVSDSQIKILHIWITGDKQESIELEGLVFRKEQDLQLLIEGSLLDMRDSWVDMYSLALWVPPGEFGCRKDVTLRNSEICEIFLVFAADTDFRIRDMRPGHYENWNIHDVLDGSGPPWNLTLINTSLNIWKLDFQGVTEIQDSMFHLDTWGNSQVTVRDCVIVNSFHSRGGRVRFIDTTFSDEQGKTTNMRLLHWRDQSGNDRHPHEYVFKNSIFGPNAELEVTHDSIHCNISGELEMKVSSDRIHWFAGTITREFPVHVLDDEGEPLVGVPMSLLSSEGDSVWSGITNEMGQASFKLTFDRDNYLDVFTLRASPEDKNLITEVGFLSDTPIILTRP
jgi:hypothetical protein